MPPPNNLSVRRLLRLGQIRYRLLLEIVRDVQTGSTTLIQGGYVAAVNVMTSASLAPLRGELPSGWRHRIKQGLTRFEFLGCTADQQECCYR